MSAEQAALVLLADAVDALAAANLDRPGIVVDFVCVYAVRTFDDEGEAETTILTSFPHDGRTPYYAALGLLEYASGRIHSWARNQFDS